MFSGFPVTNTPAVQVWDFSRGASTSADRIVSLPDDCAPIQFFKTGVASTIRIYLPPAYPEGKLLRIINSPFSSTAQAITLYSSDARGNSFGESGTQTFVYAVRAGASLEFFYTKALLEPSGVSFTSSTGWVCTSQGYVNSASQGSFAIAGGTTTATSAFAAGSGATASGATSVALGGQNALASGSAAISMGDASNASGSQSVCIGANGLANASTAVVLGGLASSRSVEGIFALRPNNSAIGGFSGITQASILLPAVQTTDATVTTLRSNSSAATTNNQLTLPSNSAYYVRGSCIANVTGAGNTKAWSFEAAIKRGANAAATSIVGAVIKNIVAADAGASTWDITVDADTTNGALRVRVTGQAATTIRWVCRLDSTEVTY
jgi:hypothetical protein